MSCGREFTGIAGEVDQTHPQLSGYPCFFCGKEVKVGNRLVKVYFIACNDCIAFIKNRGKKKKGVGN